MTREQAKNMLKAKLECLMRETSGTDFDCNNSNCDECSLCYEQGNMGEQKEALDMAIKALEHEPRWIPVSERLPKPQEDGGDKDFSDWALVSIRINPYQSIVCSAYYCFSERKWYLERMGCGVIVAWMPLPEEYKAESEDKE